MDQPHGSMERFEIIMAIWREDEENEMEKMRREPPPKQ